MQSKMTIHCLSNVTGLVKLAGIEWYNGAGGFVEPNCPCLAIVFDNGRAELRRHELDESECVSVCVCVCVCVCVSSNLTCFHLSRSNSH